MNVIQFWLIDSIVKASGTAGISLPADPADHEPLFRSSIDSGDDDNGDNVAEGGAIATLTKRDVEAQGQVQKLLRRSNDSSHTYPPSLNDSPTPAPSIHRASLSPPPASSSALSARRHHPPPPSLQPRSPMVPAVNSPDPTSVVSAGAAAVARPKEDWQAWDGEEDWVERVGEEEWTGRRAGARNGVVDGVWRGDAS
jgi:hypothetical protein